MKVRVINVFRDINTHEIYKEGEVREFDTARAERLVKLGLVEPIAKPKAKPADAQPQGEEQPAKEAEQPATGAENQEETPANTEGGQVENETADENKPAETEAKAEEPEGEKQQEVVSERHRGQGKAAK